MTCAPCRIPFASESAFDAHLCWPPGAGALHAHPLRVSGLRQLDDGTWAWASPAGARAPGAGEVSGAVRDARRTAVIVLAGTSSREEIRVCDPECRDAFLMDLGLKGSGGGWAFRSHGAARAAVSWRHEDYRVTWERRRASALPCDLCGEAWRFRPARVLPPPTEAQLRQREAFAASRPGLPPRRAP